MFYCSYNTTQGRNGPITVVVRVKKCHFICIIPLQRLYKMLNITEQYILQNNSKIFLIDLSQMFWQMSKIKEQQPISCIYFLKGLIFALPSQEPVLFRLLCLPPRSESHPPSNGFVQIRIQNFLH